MTTETEKEIQLPTEPRRRDLPPPLQPLEPLAWNYWWSWAPDGVEVFRDLDPGTWEQCERNPRALLAQTSDLQLSQMAADPAFADRVLRLSERFKAYQADTKTWSKLQIGPRISPQNPVAYFCAEYGIHSSLPLYSGGLGIIAGDHLKSASDLNLPLVAVGLLYRFGYFRQELAADGWQRETYLETSPAELAVRQVKNGNDSPLLIEVAMRGRRVRAQVWRSDIGRIALYLLDTNIPENEETDRLVT